jgi:hypothetical protein
LGTANEISAYPKQGAWMGYNCCPAIPNLSQTASGKVGEIRMYTATLKKLKLKFENNRSKKGYDPGLVMSTFRFFVNEMFRFFVFVRKISEFSFFLVSSCI